MARCTARARREPHNERGPPKACGRPVSGQAMQTASVAVPVASWPRSRSAWALASAAVATALTRAASERRSGSTASTLIVPTRSTGPADSEAGAAASTGWPSPTVATTETPPSSAVANDRTSAAVIMPTPRPGKPNETASRARCCSGSRRPYEAGTWALMTQRRSPRPPPWGAEAITRMGAGSRHTSTGRSRPASRRDRCCSSTTSTRLPRPNRGCSGIGLSPLRDSPGISPGSLGSGVTLLSGPMTRAESIVLVNTGHGKGKSSAAFGVMGRGWARGWRVGVVQFIKSGKWKTGERTLADHLGIGWHTRGGGFTWESTDLDETAAKGRHAWDVAAAKLASGDFDLLILDELTYAVKYGWVDVADVVDAVNSRAPKTNVVITGRDAPAEILDIADTATEMRKIKHAYEQGIKAIKGIEY